MDREVILTKVRERIVGFATSRLSEAVAQDLAQEVLMLLHEKYAHVTELSELLPLSFRILRFKMLDLRRKSWRRGEDSRVSLEDHALPDMEKNPETAAARKHLFERLNTAMARLGERCRQLFQWKLQGKTFPEIQRLMGQRSINTVYTWDRRCRQQLLELMGGRWETEE